MRTASTVFIYRRNRGQWCTVAIVWTCPYPQCREANHNSSLTSSTVCYFSRPPPSKGHVNKSLIPWPDDSTGILTSLSFSTKWQNSRGAGEKTAPKTHELMETGTPSTNKSLLHISGPPLNFHSSCSKTIFPPLQFPGNLDMQAEKASNLRKTAADWDKNNYSSISLPRDTLSTSSSSQGCIGFAPWHTMTPLWLKLYDWAD